MATDEAMSGSTFSHYGDQTQIQIGFWGPSMEVTMYGTPCVAILGFVCMLLLFHKKLLIEYQNTITFICFGCFFTATPIVWYNVMIFIGMEITNGKFYFTLFSCTFFKISTLSLWFCSFVVPSVVAFNRYLLIIHGKNTSIWFSLRVLLLVYAPMFCVDVLAFIIGSPSDNDTCVKLLYVNISPVPELYTLYIFLVSAGGVILGKLTLIQVKRQIISHGAKINDRQLANVIYVQTWIPFLATTFFVISNLGMITNMYSVPIWFSRPANIYAVIGTTLFIPLIALGMASKIRSAAFALLPKSLLRSADTYATAQKASQEKITVTIHTTKASANLNSVVHVS
ncbi:unnamed protein product, partial [Mesorhabditis belari]|uniref:Taste receptor type 2 n=1 Tax=Mesorhabditis belari TaxID=2138241 RepID=A0A915F2C1_9BILA